MSPTLSRSVRVVVHAGMGKTGTTTIQFFLRDNRDRLADAGWLYPRTPGAARHGRLGLYAKPDREMVASPEWQRQKQESPAHFRKAFRRQLLAEIEQSGLSKVLLSDEILLGARDATLRRLHRFLDRFADDLREVVYLRRQDDHMVSRYQQGVKIGWVHRLDEFVREDMTALYDYAARLALHEKRLTPRELVVRRFEPEYLPAGGLQQQFLDAVGIDLRAEELTQVENRNLSLDAESVEFLRLLNLYRVEHEGVAPGLIDNRSFVSRLAEVSKGPVLTLPEPVLDRFMRQWERSNRDVARRWLGDDSELLFKSPRKTRNTTTEQRFDPARVGYFLELLRLPVKIRVPLQRVADREAKA